MRSVAHTKSDLMNSLGVYYYIKANDPDHFKNYHIQITLNHISSLIRD